MRRVAYAVSGLIALTTLTLIGAEYFTQEAIGDFPEKWNTNGRARS